MASGTLVIANLTNLKIQVRAHRSGKRPKNFNVNARDVYTKGGIRISRSDWPQDYRKKVEIYDAETNNKLCEKKIRYRVALGYHAIATVSYIGGNWSLDQVDELPSFIQEHVEKTFKEELELISKEGILAASGE